MSSVKVNIFEALVGLVGCFVMVWFIVRYFKFRRLFKLSENVPSWHWNLPLVGAAYIFVGTTEAVQRRLVHLLSWCPEISKLWMGDYLTFIVNDPTYLDNILRETKKPKQCSFFERIMGNGLVTIPVEVWKPHRKMISPAFNQKNINYALEVMNEQCEILLRLLSEAPPKNVDIGKYLINCTADIVCGSIFNTCINAQTDKKLCNHDFHFIFEQTFLRVLNIWHYPDITFARMNKNYKKFIQICDKHDGLYKEVIDAKTVYSWSIQDIDLEYEDASKNNFFDSINTSFKNKQISSKEIFEEVKTMFVAATDTTSTSLSYISLILAMYPEIQEKVYSEVLDVLGPDRQMSLKDLNNLQYTECFIKEVLRIFPIVPFIARELQQDVICGDVILPKESVVVVPIFAVHRNEKYWKDPLKFDPDRFLPQNFTKQHPNSFIPFGLGPRNCIGFKYGMLVMKVVTSMIVRKFRLTCDESLKTVEDIEVALNIVLNPKTRIILNVEIR